MLRTSYNKSVFINCPFDAAYRPFFRALAFAVSRCDFYVRSALEVDDSSESRLAKIFRIIGECRYGIHDLSRTQLDPVTRLPRFNMPLELGIFLAAKHYGKAEQDRKSCLIFERQRHSYERFISDIKGQDIAAHDNDVKIMLVRVRDWLAAGSRKKAMPGGHVIWGDYCRFRRWLTPACRAKRLREKDLTFDDYMNLVYEWIDDRAAQGRRGNL